MLALSSSVLCIKSYKSEGYLCSIKLEHDLSGLQERLASRFCSIVHLKRYDALLIKLIPPVWSAIPHEAILYLSDHCNFTGP
jgi:hypothetical protein